MIEELKKYFAENSREQILADLEKFDLKNSSKETSPNEFSEEISVEEFLELHQTENEKIYEVIIDNTVENESYRAYLKKKNIQSEFYRFTTHGAEYLYSGSFVALLDLIGEYFNDNIEELKYKIKLKD
jgi:hypothetical protein